MKSSLKKGMVVELDTAKLLKEYLCHKEDNESVRNGLAPRCGANKLPLLTHANWEMVNCPDCLMLKVEH